MAELIGANLDDLASLSARFAAAARTIVAARGQVERTMSAAWAGRDAEAFRQTWSSSHRAKLQAIVDGLNEASRQIDQQAREQAGASDVKGSPGLRVVAGTGLGVAGTFVGSTLQGSNQNLQGGVKGGGQPSAATHTVPVETAGIVGASSGALPNSHRSWQEVQREYEATNLGGYSAGGSSGYQCTAWANFRWREMGYHGFVSGDGWQMAANAPGDPSTSPTLGALASTNAANNHVMVVEEIAKGPAGELRIRVSEMNTGSDGSDWQHASAVEYSDQRWLRQQGDGSWLREGTRRTMPLLFAPFPK